MHFRHAARRLRAVLQLHGLAESEHQQHPGPGGSAGRFVDLRRRRSERRHLRRGGQRMGVPGSDYQVRVLALRKSTRPNRLITIRLYPPCSPFHFSTVAINNAYLPTNLTNDTFLGAT